MMIIGISLSLGSVAIPLITEKFVKKDLKARSHLVADNLQLLFIFTIPAIVGTVLLAGPLYTIFTDRQSLSPLLYSFGTYF